MFEHYTPEMIKNRILARLQSKLETREGSVTNDQVSGVSYELWIAYQMMDSLIPIFYVDETSGIYLDKQAGDFGIVRKSGAYAHASIHFTGKAGTTIPAGMAYNIDAADITSMLRNISGLTSYENEAAVGGVDMESNRDYLARYREYLSHPPTSGNGYHYQQWAMEVNGVGAARILKVWNGGGTVKCILASPDMEPVDEAVVASTSEHIAAECPVGAEATCLSVLSQAITVSASVTLEDTASLSIVQAAMVSNLDTYLRQLVKTDFAKVIDVRKESLDDYAYKVLYSRIGFYLLSIDGVLDYSNLTVNGATANVIVPYDTIPVAGEVTLT